MKVVILFIDEKINQIIINERSFDAKAVARVFARFILISLVWFEISRNKFNLFSSSFFLFSGTYTLVRDY